MDSNKAIVTLALLGCTLSAGWAAAAAPPAAPSFHQLDDAEALKRLPREETPLPAWARVLAGSLPRTTAHMLAMDHLHRAECPLDAGLRGKLRWAVADVNRCAYSKRYAEFDLKRAGAKASEIEALAGDLQKLSGKERLALAFARKTSRDASSVTDGEVAELIGLFGEKQVVAIVHVLAFANFQDRVFMALGVEVEKTGPFAPLEWRVPTVADPKKAAPARPPWKAVREAKVSPDQDESKPDWRPLEVAEVREALEAQKRRKPRIAPPKEGLASMPADVRQRMQKIGWSAVSLGYQPRLTTAWFDCMGTFSQEAKLDPVFSSSLFWVVTRGVDCFY